MKKIFYFIAFFAVVAMFNISLNSCSGCGDHDKERDTDTTGTTKTIVPKKVMVNVYIDNSSSMKGYFDSNNSAPMIEVLSGLTQFYNDKKINGYYMNVDSLVACSWDELTSNITKRKFSSYSDAMQIDVLIEQIMAAYKNDSKKYDVVNFILTDGIPSGTNEEVRRDANFNINSASQLQVRVATAIKGEKLAASVYKFNSGFDGTYYFYDNSSKKMSLKSRPFYLIAIGNKKLVMDLAEKENTGLNMFKAEEKVHYGTVEQDEMKLTSSSFYPGTMNIPEEEFKNGGEDVEKMTVNMQISINGLPYFARNQKYLEKYMTLTLDGKDVKNFKVEGQQLTIPMTVEQSEEYIIKVKIKNSTPSWVERTTCTDDKKATPDELTTKTFNLEYLVEGLNNGVTHSKGEITLFEKEFKVTTCAENNSEDEED